MLPPPHPPPAPGNPIHSSASPWTVSLFVYFCTHGDRRFCPSLPVVNCPPKVTATTAALGEGLLSDFFYTRIVTPATCGAEAVLVVVLTGGLQPQSDGTRSQRLDKPWSWTPLGDDALRGLEGQRQQLFRRYKVIYLWDPYHLILCGCGGLSYLVDYS